MVPAGTHPAVVWGILIGSEIPDIDFVIRYWGGPVGYLRNHRGPTHGIVSLVLESALITVGLRLLWPSVGFWTLFGWTLLGCLSHVLFDVGNDYGTQALWPISRRWLALDLLPIIDFYLLAGVAAGWGINWAWPGYRLAVFSGLWFAIAAYVLLRLWLHRTAWRLATGHFDLSEPCGDHASCGVRWPSERLTIHPSLLSLTVWRYVVQVPGEYLVGRVWVAGQRVGAPERARNEYDRIVKASLQAQIVTAFRDWVRRPRVEVEQQKGLYHVVWSDMRYEVGGYAPFTAYAWLNENLKLIDEGLGPQRPARITRDMLKHRLLFELGRE